MNLKLTLLLFFSLLTNFCFGQKEITLKNPSFECNPQRGGLNNNPVKDWYDCGRRNFKYESAPDIHPAGLWENTLPASEGKTYLGIVVRDNETWESVSQRLSSPILVGNCYELSLEIAQSSNYWSGSREEQEQLLKQNKRILPSDLKKHNYSTPTVLRIWGATKACGVQQLLAESSPVSSSDWKTYHFVFKPNDNYQYLVFEAFYITPVLVPYNGHILLDNISSLIEVGCNKEVEEITTFIPNLIEDEQAEEVVINVPAPRKKRKIPKVKKKKKPSKETPLTYTNNKKKELPKHGSFSDIELKKLKKGHILSLEKVYFNSDTSSVERSSYVILDELFDFLDENKNLKVEIGGHTNSTPSKAYCDRLSTERAKVVADYLINKGIDKKRITYKGYGKHRPIANNNTKKGRKKNQRVEVKIIETR